MHEVTIAMQVLAQVLALAARERLLHIAEIELVCGVRRQIVPAALQTAFEVVSENTVAAAARLILHEEPLRARCNGCATEFAPEIDDYLCRTCGAADVTFVAGDDIVLAAVVADQATAGDGSSA